MSFSNCSRPINLRSRLSWNYYYIIYIYKPELQSHKSNSIDEIAKVRIHGKMNLNYLKERLNVRRQQAFLALLTTIMFLVTSVRGRISLI